MSSLLMVCMNLSYNHSPLLPILPNAQTNHVDNRQPFPLYDRGAPAKTGTLRPEAMSRIGGYRQVGVSDNTLGCVRSVG
jgi:hypothetical protein